MPKKPTKVEQLTKANQKIYSVLDALDMEDITSFIISEVEWDIGYIQDEIESELAYIKNETDSYASAKADSRKLIKVFRKNKQVKIKVLKQLKQAFAALQKIKDL